MIITNDTLYNVLLWHRDAGVFEITDNVLPSDTVCIHTSRDACSYNSLDELKIAMMNAPCPLKHNASNFVFSDGPTSSSILFLGEAPGADEDAQGIPFVGASGQLLNKMLLSIGLERENVYITNIVPWRPPANRTPTPDEIALFRPFVIAHIKIINPALVVCLGSTATKALLNKNVSISSMRQNVFYIDDLTTKIVATFHPSYLLRSPLQKREAWRDFILIKNLLKDA